MGHTSKIFERQPIEVQRRNGFDLSHIVAGTSKTGQLVPVLKHLLMPDSKFSLGAAVQCELPPLATSFFGKIDFCIEVFLVPCSILYGGWRQFISNNIATEFPQSQSAISGAGGYKLPLIDMNSEEVYSSEYSLSEFSNSVLRYLGFNYPMASEGAPVGTLRLNMLPLLAYHRICDVYYRNPQVTKTWFAVNPNLGGGSSVNEKNVSLVWHSFYSDVDSDYSPIFSTVASLTFPDGISIFSTRQRPWSRDYFTSASVDPQQGSRAVVSMESLDSSGETSFSIASLRAANSLQKFLEANNYGMTYRDSMRAQFGITPGDALLDEPMYLGRLVIPVYQKSVYNSNQGVGDGNGRNPFTRSQILGAKGASGSFSGNGSIVQSFHCKQFSYLMAIASLVPHTMYNYGIDRDLMRHELGDFPFPLLQGVGMDSIKNYEVYYDYLTTPDSDFAYIPRYSYEKYINDHAVGLLVPNHPADVGLDSFVLQRSFSRVPTFGSQFLTIPQNALNSVFAVDIETSLVSCWWEIFWEFKCSKPLAEFCVPTLGEMKDTRTIHVTQGGSRL